MLPAFLCVTNICSLISNQKHKTLFVQPLTLLLGNELMNTSFVNCISVPEALPSRRTKLAGAGQGWRGASFPSQKAAGATRSKTWRPDQPPLTAEAIPLGAERWGAAPGGTARPPQWQSPKPRAPGPPGPSPARSPTQPSLVRLLVQRLHDAGRAGLRLPQNTSSQPHFRLPASSLRTRPFE